MAFEARIDGPCARECSTMIKVGDLIESAPHVRHFHRDANTFYPAYQHVECPPEPDPLATGVCPRCYLALPVTGECGDCD